MFEKIRLRSRILLGFLVPLLSLFIVGVLVFTSLNKASEQNKLVASSHDTINASTALIRDLTGMRRAFNHSLILKSTTSRESYQEASKSFKERAENLNKTIVDATQREKIGQLLEAERKLTKLVLNEMDLIDVGKVNDAITAWSTTNQQIVADIEKLQTEFVDDENKTLAGHQETYQSTMEVVKNSIIYGMLISTVIAIGIALWLARSVSRDIVETASQLSAAATEISATIAQHERTANQQSAAANQASATIEELSASSLRSAEQAASAAAAAEKASMATIQGGEATHQAVVAMSNLKDKIAAMAEQILRLGEQTSQIGGIAMLVKDLSGQINMLALNAAVEAARAGEHGKGFAVVASEVRKLADQSKKSAEQATVAVADIQKTTNSSIIMTEEGTRIVAEVTQLAQKVAEVFNNLSGMANVVNENAHQVMLNAKQQSGAFVQMVEATNSISAGAKESAAGISQTKIGIKNLNETAIKLQSIA